MEPVIIEGPNLRYRRYSTRPRGVWVKYEWECLNDPPQWKGVLTIDEIAALPYVHISPSSISRKINEGIFRVLDSSKPHQTTNHSEVMMNQAFYLKAGEKRKVLIDKAIPA